ncbi:hypothetical protein NLJ89_g4907 [Agrocybe chaxingu]|uniref:DUF6533 domain-containing protein n=1 Tax=Agrocybe chaxingu TaxID=84603 RepID=A0A9W8K1N6_9AGAR|nr:hypothetical protein NLJ89_g4907 [Agrocybe chaxingu]
MAAPSPSPDALAAIIDRIRISGNARNFEVAAASFFVWDYFLTLGMEVNYVWPGPWTPIKVIFFVQRYLPFFDTVWMGVHQAVGMNVNTATLILTFRVWAVWNRSKPMTFILLLLYAGFWIPQAPILYVFLKSLKYIPPPPALLGCLTLEADPIIVWVWVLIVVWDALILCLMLVPAVKAYRFRGNSALFHTVYAEGILYYVYLFTMSLLNIILLRLAALDVAYRFVLVSISRCLHSTLTSRALLHVRAGADRDAQHHIEHISIDSDYPRRQPQTQGENFKKV